MQTWASPVGTSAADMTSLAKALLPSSRAARADGPKHAIPAARTASATPATSGASGPTTTRSAPRWVARAVTPSGLVTPPSTAWQSASAAMPGFPGAATTSSTDGSSARERTMACSRAPDPTTSTFTGHDPRGDPPAPATGPRRTASGPRPVPDAVWGGRNGL